MDINALTTTLETHGIVEFCDFNGSNTSTLIIVIVLNNQSQAGIDAFNNTISTDVIPEFPIVGHFGYNDGKIKCEYHQ